MGDNDTRQPDFSGYASKYGVKCSDGQTIMHGAFKHLDGARLPLIWNHEHKNNEQVLGYVDIVHREDGPYVNAYFNETTKAKAAKAQIEHGDITAMSVWANDLDRRGTRDQVFHGEIREVSLVLAGANKDARIESVYLRHADGSVDELDEATIVTGEDIIVHAAAAATDETPKVDPNKTVKDYFDGLEPEEKDVVIAMMNQSYEAGKAAGAKIEHSATADEVEGADKKDDESQKPGEANQNTEPAKPLEGVAASEAATGDEANKTADAATDADAASKTDTKDDASTDEENAAKDVKTDTSKKEGSKTMGDTIEHNAFQTGSATAASTKPVIAHSDMKTIWQNAFDRNGKLSTYLNELAHAGTYGITDIELMFPDAKNLDSSPQLLARQVDWVPKVLDAVKRQPWAKVKSIVADLTEDEARAKGYVKGNEKIDEVISLMRRTTGPVTIYKKQRLDRDDVIDITDFDVLSWIKWEMRFMLNEELARAILIGDGRPANDRDKIKDPKGVIDGVGIRSILHDDPLYVVKKELAANVQAATVVDEMIRIRSKYRGSGNPTLYTTDETISDILLLKDKMGRYLYDTVTQLADKLRVKEIVAVEAFNSEPTLLGIIVNLVDYTVGTNKGGELSFFEDFDLDFNQNKFLLETRLSGALTRLKAALVLTRQLGEKVALVAPSFNGATNTISLPDTEGVEWYVNDERKSGDVVITKNSDVEAKPAAGYYIESNLQTEWAYTYTPGA